MNAVVVYDTEFGNTEQIARAIASELEAHGIVRLLAVAEAEGINLAGVDLLVIGGPTQGHSARPALRQWVEELPAELLAGMPVATFDTRVHWPMLLSGSAAHTLAKSLRHHGARFIVPPESFFVTGREGPLAPGEIEHATVWAGTLARSHEAETATLNPVQSTPR